MPGFGNISEYALADAAGRTITASYRKTPVNAVPMGWWSDFSMVSGNPPPNYYAASPLEAATLVDFKGIFHGDDQSPATKFLAAMALVTPTAAIVGPYKLLDYLLYYPFIDGDSSDEQAMVNDTTLPRYTTGDGVMVMAVAVTPSTGGGSFTFNYIDQDGNAKTSPVQVCSTTAANIGNIVTSQQNVTGMPGGPFLTLASGSTGVRSITSVTFSVLNGGLLALVLVKPLADLCIREINTEAELSYVNQKMPPPRIYDGAYLNLIGRPTVVAGAATLAGRFSFLWSG